MTRYRVSFRNLSMKNDEWVEEDAMIKHTPEAAASSNAEVSLHCRFACTRWERAL